MTPYILPMIFVLAFLAVAIIAQVFMGAAFAKRAQSERVNRRLTLLDSGMDRREVYDTLVRKRASPKLRNPSLLEIYERATLYLSQAGLTVSPLFLFGVAVAICMSLWLSVNLFLRAMGNPSGLTELVISFAGAASFGGMIVWTWVSGKRKKRLKLIEEQLPLALDIVVRGLRAGHPVTSAMNLVTQEMGDPIGSDFGIIIDETSYGLDFTESLVNFARRTGSEDAHFFAVSVAIQSETGGNLSEILNNLAAVIRSRITLGQRIRALSSEGRMSGWILSALPVFLISTITLTQPSYYNEAFADPIFWPTVVSVLSVYVLGLFMMHRITNFKY